MPRIKYETIKFKPDTLATIGRANGIITEYHELGFDLTLRQIFYQFVSRGWIANSEREYKKLGDVINNGRMAGMIDWEVITDRTRYIRDLPHWDSPSGIVGACAKQYRINKWERQPVYVEVAIEKDALIGVIEGVCQENDVPYIACRGYASASEVWRMGHRRFRPRLTEGKKCILFYLGDHDPSGLDMTRDLRDRLDTFTGSAGTVSVERLALNMDQIELYAPPPNPAKTTDVRAKGYIEEHGEESWELDALDPVAIRNLIQEAIEGVRDDDLWQEAVDEETEAKTHLSSVADNWDAVVASL